MKNYCLLIMIALLMAGKMDSQTVISRTVVPLSPHRIFDRVSDRFGSEYQLQQLQLNSSRPISGGTIGINAIPTNTCNGGYFNLFIEQGSYLDLNPTAANVVCEVFRNISGFINSPLATNGVKINIYCANTPASMPAGVLAAASSFYLYPYNPINPNQGILYNQIQKGLISGVDPFANLPISAFAGATNFYSGYIYVNPAISWHTNMASFIVSPSSADFFSTILHEVCHALGFASLISSNGISQLGVNSA